MIKRHHLALSIIAIVVLVVAVTSGLYIGHKRKNNTNSTETFTLKTNTQTTTAAVSLTSSGPNPASLLVKSGSNVKWLNQDSKAHTLDSNSGIVSKITLQPNQQYTVVITNTGTYDYSVDGKPGSIIAK